MRCILCKLLFIKLLNLKEAYSLKLMYCVYIVENIFSCPTCHFIIIIVIMSMYLKYISFNLQLNISKKIIFHQNCFHLCKYNKIFYVCTNREEYLNCTFYEVTNNNLMFLLRNVCHYTIFFKIVIDSIFHFLNCTFTEK